MRERRRASRGDLGIELRRFLLELVFGLLFELVLCLFGHAFQSSRGIASGLGHCGSTSTLTLTPRLAASGPTASTAAPTAAIAARRSVDLSTSWLRARPRSRNSGAGPSTLVPGGSMRSRRALAAVRASAGSIAEQTTRISDPYGG